MKKSAFTLIELLITVSVMATLTGMVAMNVFGSLAKARDAKRKQDLRTLRTAIDLYFNINGIYPPSSDATTWAPFTSSVTEIKGCGTKTIPTSCDWGDPWTQGGVLYMPSLPKDPKGGQKYFYFRGTNSRLNYFLAAKLERANDPDIETTKNNCDDTANGYALINNADPLYVICDTK